MRLEFEPNTSAVPFVEKDVISQNVAADTEKMLREGIKAAQEGKRAEARNLLLRVAETEADNENAWLWLASISEYPEELLVFLNNVLRINQQNERALEWHKATKSLLAKTLVQRGTDAAQENRREFARQCFEQALEHESGNEMALLWMASVADSDDEKEAFFEQVLSVNAENATARESLKAIQSRKTEKLFGEALAAAFDGRHREAQDMLAAVLSRESEMEDAWVLKAHLANSFEERAECFLKLSALNPENEMARANLASWRVLSEKRAGEPPAEERVESFSPESDEQVSGDFSNYSFDESETGQEASATIENQTAEFSAAETRFDAPETVQEVSVANAFAMDEYEHDAESPTQELSFDYAEQNQAAEENSAEEFQPEEFQPEEFQPAEVSFESDEAPETVDEFSAEPGDVASATEAEEAEMDWAFSNSQKVSGHAEDYFQNFDDADDIHKTQQSNYGAEVFAPANFAVEEPTAEVFAEMPVEAANAAAAEEWRDTSPTVFVNYSPVEEEENFFEVQPVEEFTTPETVEPEEAALEFSAGGGGEFSGDEEFSAPENADEEAVEAVEEQFSMEAEETVQPQSEEKAATPKMETVLCPFCNVENEKQAFACSSCQTVLTLSDLEMLLNQQCANQEKLSRAVQSMERENESYGLNAEQLMNLGVGHVNLKNYRQGFLYLQEAVRTNPSNVLLDAQVNALAIRLSEMEEQQIQHDSMSKNRRILVVDDSPTVRKLISGKLEKCGHEVICAIDGVDALEKINDIMPDLVLLDITMPRMDGYQVCKLIRGNEATKDVPVVMISGKDGFFDKVRGRMAGTTGYITKPFGPETLMKTVETYLN
ncbi:MAG TPA: response regulator [Pyrinomonadaceae bacterium]|jgi:CheY-like chemotaxis protein